jgi:DNA-binding GntR family transcriptional regulator
MKNDDSKKPAQPLEGEGSYTATRRYNQHLGDAIDAGDVEAAADAARRAMEGPERAELERAAEEGKAGPKKKPADPAPKPARAHK